MRRVDLRKNVTAEKLALLAADALLMKLTRAVKPMWYVCAQRMRAAGVRPSVIHKTIAERFDMKPDTVKKYLQRARRKKN